MRFAQRGAIALLAIALLAAEPLRDVRTLAGIEAILEMDSAPVSLSGKLILTLRVEGDAPLRVILPKNLLQREFSLFWRVRQQGPSITQSVSPSRERFVQKFELSPYLAGTRVPIQINEIEVREGTSTSEKTLVFEKRFEIEVQTQITDASLKNLIPLTEMERLPPGDEPTATSTRVWWLLLIPFAVIVYRFRPRTPQETQGVPFSREWTQNELRDLESNPLPLREWCECYLVLLRGFLEQIGKIRATRLTPPELISALPELSPELRAFLLDCERIRFQSGNSNMPAPFSRHDPIRWTLELIETLSPDEKMGK